MTTSVQAITLTGLIWGFAPALIVIGILYRWKLNPKTSSFALARMLIQLVAVGYVLTFIFNTEHPALIMLVLTVMLVAGSVIALRPLQNKSPNLYFKALIALSIGGIPVLVLATQVILAVEPWFLPRYVVPLAGMIFANSMNTLSLAAERFSAETERGNPYLEARIIALHTALIPTINSLIAVGLVALPGMMTGQILSGVPPLVTVKYQIIVMCMIFGASGISATAYLVLVKEDRV